jgi:hypothetical protein
MILQEGREVAGGVVSSNESLCAQIKKEEVRVKTILRM